MRQLFVASCPNNAADFVESRAALVSALCWVYLHCVLHLLFAPCTAPLVAGLQGQAGKGRADKCC